MSTACWYCCSASGSSCTPAAAPAASGAAAAAVAAAHTSARASRARRCRACEAPEGVGERVAGAPSSPRRRQCRARCRQDRVGAAGWLAHHDHRPSRFPGLQGLRRPTPAAARWPPVRQRRRRACPPVAMACRWIEACSGQRRSRLQTPRHCILRCWPCCPVGHPLRASALGPAHRAELVEIPSLVASKGCERSPAQPPLTAPEGPTLPPLDLRS